MNQASMAPFGLVREHKIDIDGLSGLTASRLVSPLFHGLNRSWREERVAADDFCILDGSFIVDDCLYFDRALYSHLGCEGGVCRRRGLGRLS